MKASDSTNSLTELNPSSPSEKCCFICLGEDLEAGEPLVDSKLLRNCGCKFSVHPACWNEWMKGKSDYDCPICHKESVKRFKIKPNPVMEVEYEQEQEDHYSFQTKAFRVFFCSVFTVGSIMLILSIKYWG